MINKKNIGLISLIAFSLIIGATAIYFVMKGPKDIIDDDHIPDEYTIGAEHTPGYNFSAIVHKREEFLPGQGQPTFNFNLEVPNKNGEFDQHYAIDYPYVGYNCGLLAYEIYLQDDYLILDQLQEPNCDQEQKYYITTYITDHRDFKNIRIRQKVNGEVKNFYQWNIEEEVKRADKSRAE